ncbi:MAG TPA: hypothetical protein VGK69_07220 [Gaiellaceae bacterium]
MTLKKPTPVGALLTIVVLALSLALVPAALAGKGKPGGGGGGGGGNSLSLVLSTDVNGNGVANWGDTITYNVSTGSTSAPQVRTSCYQNGVLVLHADAAFYSGNPFAYMDWLQLTSGMWTGGAADCTATMYYTSHKSTVTLATLNFHVDA